MPQEPPVFLPEERQPEPLLASAPRKRKPAGDQDSVFYMPLWAVMLTFVAVFGAAACLAVAVIGLGGRATFLAGEPDVVVLSAVPSETPEGGLLALVASPTVPLITLPTQGPAPEVIFQGPTLAPTLTPTSTPAVIAVGARVEVVNRAGSNVRETPGTDNTANRVLRVVNFGHVFEIIAGPQQANGLTFWQVRDPQNGQTGWIAEYDGQSQILRVMER